MLFFTVVAGDVDQEVALERFGVSPEKSESPGRVRRRGPGAIGYEFSLALNCVSGRLEDIDVYGSVGRGDAVYVQAYSGILRFMILI